MMRNKVWLIVGASLILAGALIFVGVMSMLNWNFKKLSTVSFQTTEHEITTEFKDISISTDTADITFIPSTDGKVHITSYEEVAEPHRVTVENGVLTIKLEHHKKWYQYIAIGFSSPKLTVALPQEEYGALGIKASTGDTTISQDFTFRSMEIAITTGDITSNASVSGAANLKVSTGDIAVRNISAGSLSLQVSTGDTEVSNVHCGDFSSSGTTGNITLDALIATGKLDISRSTGDVTFTGCDAAELLIKTTTGDVSGTLLSDKIFVTNTSTGNIRVPESVTGGKCKITTSTGNITVSIAE